jgi:hypothetical protein
LVNTGSEATRRLARLLACSIRQHTSAYVSIRQHTSAYEATRRLARLLACCHACSIRQHTSAYVSIRMAPRIRSAVVLSNGGDMSEWLHERVHECVAFAPYVC